MRQPLAPQQARARTTMHEVLAEDFLQLEVLDYDLHERADGEACRIVANVVEQPGGRRFACESRGVGMLDAFFRGLCDRYRPEHPSLGTIRFSSFSVRGLMKDGQEDRTSDAAAEATVGIRNSADTEFHFSALSPSVGLSSLEAVLAAVEYFLNSERAYVRLYKARQHHQKSGRPELVGRYTELLAQMVQNTSYSSAVERLQQE
jgi:hypothetical protein